MLKSPRPGWELCVSTDALVEGVHFQTDTFSFQDIGHKALAVNLSDLAAMGAHPAWFVCALGLPAFANGSAVKAVAQGMAALARAYRISLVGGNISKGPGWSITVTVAGEVEEGTALLRSEARAGDRLYVSGELGEAARGLAALGRGRPNALEKKAVARQRRPTPRVSLGKLAARFARAAMDLSDGLAEDLPRFCAASGVGATVNAASLPVAAEAVALLGRSRASAGAWWGGEDYELLMAVPAKRATAFETACAQLGEKVTWVGDCTQELQVRCEGLDLEAEPSRQSFRHFG